MLKTIEIKNFRSCKDTSATDLPALLALLGRNAAGKTNILRCIQWAANLAGGDMNDEAIFRYVIPGDLAGQPHLSVSVELPPKKTYTYKVGTTLKFDGDPPKSATVEMHESLFVQDHGGARTEVCSRRGETIKLAGNGESIKIGALAPCLPALNSLLRPSTPILKTIRPLLDFFRRVRYYPLNEPSDATDQAQSSNAIFVQDDEYKKWLTQYEQTKVPGNSILMRLIHMHSNGRLGELEAVLGNQGLGLINKISVAEHSFGTEAEEGKRKPQRRVVHVISFHVANSDPEDVRTSTIAQLSCGTRRILRIMTSLLFDNASIMLMEHPEDGIHTGLVRKLASHIRRSASSTQVIMSSHSLTLLNTLAPNEIRLVTMDAGKTNIRAFTPKELSAAVKFISEQGGNLADYVESVEE